MTDRLRSGLQNRVGGFDSHSGLSMKSKFLIIAFILSLSLSSCSLPSSKKSALKINTDPQASVFLDGQKIGSTPFFDDKLKEGEYTIKLIPENGIGLQWEKRIKLLAGIETQISRKLAEDQDQINGYDFSMEPNFLDTPSLVLIAEPAGAIIKIDGETKGFSPIDLKNVSAGERLIQVTSPGYIDRDLRVNFFPKYKVNAYVQLAKSDKYQEAIINPSSSSAELKINDNKKAEISLDDNLDSLADNETDSEVDLVGQDLKAPYVTIGDTSTGWLNIRSQPSTSQDNIIKKAKPGERYRYIDKNEAGWFKIEIKNGEIGWLSSKYVTLTKD